MRVNVGGTDDLDIPPNQNWIDVNFGSKTITMFVMSMSEVSSNVLNKINMVVCLNNLGVSMEFTPILNSFLRCYMGCCYYWMV